MQRKIFAVLLVAAVIAMATPAVQAKCLYFYRGSQNGCYEGFTGSELVSGTMLGSATNEINFQVDFMYPTALGSTYVNTGNNTSYFANRSDGVVLHEGLGCSSSTGMLTSNALALSGAWAGLNTSTIYVDGSSTPKYGTSLRGPFDAGTGQMQTDALYGYYTGLFAFGETHAGPLYTAADMSSGTDPNGNTIPKWLSTATSYPLRLMVVRPIPTPLGPQNLQFVVTTNGSLHQFTSTAKFCVDMTSRTLGATPTLGGGDQSAHNNYMNNVVYVPYDHLWHTLGVQISHVVAGSETTSPTATLSMDGTVLINDYLSGAEYKALNSYAAQEKALGVSGSYYNAAWNTGRNFVLDSAFSGRALDVINNGAAGTGYTGAVRWDNIVINGKSLEQFNLGAVAYQWQSSVGMLSRYLTRPTGFAPCLQRSDSAGFCLQDVVAQSPYEKLLGARDWTIY
jgi:hypothetical protein